jgi:hypothetical protein
MTMENAGSLQKHIQKAFKKCRLFGFQNVWASVVKCNVKSDKKDFAEGLKNW